MTPQEFEIGIGVSADKDYLVAVKEAVQQARASFSANTIDIALLFTTIDYAHPNTIEGIHAILSPAPVIGCSTAAILSPQGVLTRGVAVMLLHFPPGIVHSTALVQNISHKLPLLAGEQLGEEMLHAFRGVREFGIVLCDGGISDGSSFVGGLQERLGISFPLIGAAASDDLRFSRTHVFYQQHLCTDAANGLLMGGKLSFGIGVRHGWKPLGKPRTVTRAENNVVYEIDGVSATNMYEDYFACDLPTLKKNRKHIAAMYPIGLYVEGERELLLRGIQSFNDNGSLLFQGTIPQGSTLRLMIGTKDSCLEATRLATEEAVLNLKHAAPKFVLVFESVSRYMLLGRQMHKEIDVLRTAFPGVPFIGICSYGEMAPLRSIDFKGKVYFHNQTVSVLAVGG